VLTPGPLSTLQDLGRPGLADMGIGAAGAADRGSLALANRLVGNAASAAGIEVTFGGLSVEAECVVLVAVCGAPCPLRLTSGAGAMNAPFYLRGGQRLTLGRPRVGLRTYLAVRGGVDLPAVLGSRSTDLLAGLGPEPLTAGDHLPLGADAWDMPGVDVAAVGEPTAGTLTLTVRPGPRLDWFVPDAVRTLATGVYEVSPQSNRIGMRLLGPTLDRARHEELPSEGMVPGALQVPPSGCPTVLLVDHPVTGGYPVIAVVAEGDLDSAAQARPGQRVLFRVKP
jgi:biotin-dependent carboxylase-like uncharacterized protein